MTPRINIKRQTKIKWKLFSYIASFTAIVLILIWLLQIVFLNEIYRSIKVNEIKEAAHEIKTASKKPIQLDNEALKIANNHDLCIIAYRIDKNGTASLLFSHDTIINCAIHNMTGSEILSFHKKAKLGGGKAIQYYIFDPSIDEFIPKQNDIEEATEALIYAFIIQDTFGNDMLFVLNSLVSPVDATIKTLNNIIIIIGGIMIIMSLILTLILSKAITDPISRISKSAIRLASGDYSPSFPSGNYREISELSQTLNYAASELSKTDRLRSELIANTSHDLRTPLTMITGYAEIMRDLPDENTPENAQIIIDESKRLTSLVNDMLDISKLESGAIPTVMEQFCLTETISEELKRYQQLCKRDGYTIVFEANEVINVTTDRKKLIQALFNLVNNALTYTGEDKLVIVRQEKYFDEVSKTPYVRLSVIDTGEGIPKEKLDLIWDRYYKLESTHKRSAFGSGLGLSIVRKIMDTVGGRCGVLSSNGNGSIFWIEIPL